ncbi:hypothetical protein HYV74_02410 [Candidatus Uhrbacteria bacterium]|nr:hypothetical protein [Candidatus Uhrbacteria bacterium]
MSTKKEKTDSVAGAVVLLESLQRFVDDRVAALAAKSAASGASLEQRVAELDRQLVGALEQIQHLEDAFARVRSASLSGSQRFRGKQRMERADGDAIREQVRNGVPRKEIQREFRKKGYTTQQIAGAIAQETGGHRARRMRKQPAGASGVGTASPEGDGTKSSGSG